MLHVDWKVSIFCQNEERRIADCLNSVNAAIAASGKSALIIVRLNGSTDGSAAAARAVTPLPNAPIGIVESGFADKSSQINEEIYAHDADAELHFFIDGYATINAGAFRDMAAAIRANPRALAATGVAANGRTEIKSRATTLRGGVMHGQFYALTRAFKARMTEAGFRLPMGLYRGDGLLGSMACMALDPVHLAWDNDRLIGVAGAEFTIDQLSLFNPSHLRRQFRRKVRQMRGKIENAAIKTIVHAAGYGALPAHADVMIAEYLADHPVPTVFADRPAVHGPCAPPAQGRAPTASRAQTLTCRSTLPASAQAAVRQTNAHESAALPGVHARPYWPARDSPPPPAPTVWPPAPPRPKNPAICACVAPAVKSARETKGAFGMTSTCTGARGAMSGKASAHSSS